MVMAALGRHFCFWGFAAENEPEKQAVVWAQARASWGAAVLRPYKEGGSAVVWVVRVQIAKAELKRRTACSGLRVRQRA